ncbi:MAG: hypothetical protein AAGF96_15180 [Bacteroidota bacterium]
MPANRKYLLQTRLGRTSKVLAAILGSLVASIMVHLVLAFWIGRTYMVPISMMTFLMLWIAFMVFVYWIKKPWKAWVLLLSITVVCAGLVFLAKM